MSNVADVKSKTIKIALSDGVQRTVRFTLNALAELRIDTVLFRMLLISWKKRTV